MLALTFDNKEDYDKVQEDDTIDIIGLTAFAPGKPLTMMLHHHDGSTDIVSLIILTMSTKSNGSKRGVH